MSEKQYNILLSAFACAPLRGSEPGVGWNWAINLAKNHNVYVITREEWKNEIESYLQNHPIPNLKFEYLDARGLWNFIDKRIPYGFVIYYKYWQNKVLHVGREICSRYKIDIIHHITYNEFRTPGKLYLINKPFIWGPLGGGHRYKKVLSKAFFRKSDIFKETVRNILNDIHIKYSKDLKKVLKVSRSIIIADPATAEIMPNSRKYERLLETAYYPERNPIKQFADIQNGIVINLMYAGELIPRKGLKLLIEALGESDFRDFNLCIVGEGRDRGLLELLVKSYSLENHVTFKGRVSYSEVNNFYDNADLFIFPSLRDTSGNVILEAMSHGVPVIALNHNGASEMITEEAGELIEITEYEQIKKDLMIMIQKYYNNRTLLKEKGMKARERIERVYSWDYVMNRIDNIYCEALTENLKG